MKPFLPEIKSHYKIKSDVEVALEWNDNLVFLREIKLTGVVSREYERIIYNFGGGGHSTEKYEKKITICNPLYSNPDGTYVPASITIPAGTVISMTNINVPKRQNPTFVNLKIISSPLKGARSRNIKIKFSEFMEFDLEEVQC